MSETINIPRESTMREILEALKTIAIAQTLNTAAVSDFESIRNLVRKGYGPDAFPVGSQIQVEHQTYGTLYWDVVAHDYDTEYSGKFPHSMTLLTHDCPINSAQFDNTEALYYCETELAAGTYHFTLLANYDVNYGGGKTLQFTLTKPVPAGGVIMFPWAYQKQSTETKVSTYSTRESTTAVETVAVTEGSGGTNLGTADGKTANMNHTHRVRYGSNNWKESSIRQALNTNKAKGTFWTPQTKFDRPPSWNSSLDGFMLGLPAEFLAICAEVDHVTKTNGVYEVSDNLNSQYTTRDKFWLPSYSEIFGGSENGVADGTQYPFYKNAANVDRIKRNASGAARNWFLRSPYPWIAHNVRLVGTDGALYYGSAPNASAEAVACSIF